MHILYIHCRVIHYLVEVLKKDQLKKLEFKILIINSIKLIALFL